jgi:hypothetical protein
MNLMEKKMTGLLCEMKERHNVTGVKMEFESEGTRLEEAMRLQEVCLKAGLDLTIKVGGCEAIKDMCDAASLGVKNLVGPMVESAYALRKYLRAVKLAFSSEQLQDMDVLINVETITTVKNFDEMLALPEINELNGIVIGRVDMTGSMGLSREDINSDKILDVALTVADKAKKKGLKVIVGGGVSVHSLPFFRKFPKGHLDRFETRKVVFGCPGALENTESAFLKAVEFEISWLKNKKDYYGAIHREDDARLVMMEERYRKSIDSISRK